MKLEDYIASIENYPKEGVTFRDISPLMADGNAYSYAIREIVQYATDKKIDMIVGPEARGFIVACMPMQSNQANVYLSLMTSWQLVVPSKLQLK